MLTGLFWFATIFGAGVTVIDLLGLIGGGSEEAGDGGAGEDAGAGGGESGAGGEQPLPSLAEQLPVVYWYTVHTPKYDHA